MKIVIIIAGVGFSLLGIQILETHFYLGEILALGGALVAGVTFTNMSISRTIKRISNATAGSKATTNPIRSKPIATPASNPIKTTAEKPYLIRTPSLGLLNYLNERGHPLISKDLDKLGELFPRNVHAGDQKIPSCNVLFLYCDLEPTGRIAGQQFSLRDVIRASGAYIVVVASENQPDVLTSPDFQRYLSSKNDWPANVIFTLNRNGETFGLFFQRLFSQMHSGISMPLAWVKLAPQGPISQTDCPGTIALLEAGHIAFTPT
jgi:hypothetical protein